MSCSHAFQHQAKRFTFVPLQSTECSKRPHCFTAEAILHMYDQVIDGPIPIGILGQPEGVAMTVSFWQVVSRQFRGNVV